MCGIAFSVCTLPRLLSDSNKMDLLLICSRMKFQAFILCDVGKWIQRSSEHRRDKGFYGRKKQQIANAKFHLIEFNESFHLQTRGILIKYIYVDNSPFSVPHARAGKTYFVFECSFIKVQTICCVYLRLHDLRARSQLTHMRNSSAKLVSQLYRISHPPHAYQLQVLKCVIIIKCEIIIIIIIRRDKMRRQHSQWYTYIHAHVASRGTVPHHRWQINMNRVSNEWKNGIHFFFHRNWVDGKWPDIFGRTKRLTKKQM